MLRVGSRFYFSRLTDSEKNLYRLIADSIERYEPALSIHADTNKCVALDIQKVLSRVLLDNPGLFYLNSNNPVIKQTPNYTQLYFQYDYTQAEANRLSATIKEIIEEFICSCIEPKMSSLAKQLAVYKYLQNNIDLQTSNTESDSYSVVGAFIRRTCVCEGFAKAYKLLCDYLRLASIVVSGEAMLEGKITAHAWNITRIKGVTAHADITWDTLFGSGSYDYFNLCDADIAADHSFDAALYPVCAPNKINYFYINRLIASTPDQAEKIIAANNSKEFFSIKLLFPITKAQLGGLGFPPGKLRFNETQNVVMYTRV